MDDGLRTTSAAALHRALDLGDAEARGELYRHIERLAGQRPAPWTPAERRALIRSVREIRALDVVMSLALFSDETLAASPDTRRCPSNVLAATRAAAALGDEESHRLLPTFERDWLRCAGSGPRPARRYAGRAGAVSRRLPRRRRSGSGR